jgi:hypothetical protein
MEAHMKEFGKKINKMDLVKNFGKMDLNMKVKI